MSGRSSDFTTFVLCCFAADTADTSLDCFCCGLAADASLFFLVEIFGFWMERAWLSRFRLVAGVFLALLLRSPSALLGVVVGWELKVFPGCRWTGFTAEEQISTFVNWLENTCGFYIVGSLIPRSLPDFLTAVEKTSLNSWEIKSGSDLTTRLVSSLVPRPYPLTRKGIKWVLFWLC